jgi:hypothetical protein
MSSKTEICNLALSHLGVGKEISDIETDASSEGQACRRFYDIALDTTLRDVNWPFATRFRALALIEESPNDEWLFAYRYPTDCLKVRRILSGIRNETPDIRVPYKIAQDDAGLILYTDIEDAEIEYTVRESNAELYTADFIMAFSYRLAHYIGPRVTGGDFVSLGNQIFQLYQIEISNAASSAFNEEQGERIPDSEIIRARS